LLDRLEARLAGADVADVETTGEVALPPAATTFSRRGMLAAALSLAALVLIAVGAMFWPRAGRHVTNEELAMLATDWFKLPVASAAWKPIRRAPPTAYAVPGAVSGATQWQTFSAPGGYKGVVYDLTRGALQPPARLFVIASPHKYDVRTLPFTPLKYETSIAIGAWQKNGLLYVVVVKVEGGQRLEDFVKPSNVALVCPPARPA
jgi:hypothetical protein